MADPAKGLTIRDYIQQQATTLGIPGELALAITETESGGRHGALSPKGATGFFQLMPETAKDLGVDPMDPFQNIDGGLKYFKQQLDANKGDVRLALAAYNAGPERVVNGQVPNIPETQDYVTKVLTRWQNGSPAAAAKPGVVQAANRTGEPAGTGAPEDPSNPLSALSKASGIRAVPLSARLAEYFPMLGGALGGAVGDVPGAAIGGGIGKRLEQYLNAATGFRHLPEGGDALAEVGTAALEQGAMEKGGKVVSNMLRGPMRPLTAADKELAALNRAKDLRLTASEMRSSSKAGKVGAAVEQMAQRSLSGRVIADMNRQITRRGVNEGIVTGDAALKRVGEALHQVVTTGPTYDMLPHRMEAAQIFSTEVVPKVLELYGRKIPAPLAQALQASQRAVSPDLTLRLIPKVKAVIQRGQTAPVPTAALDTLEDILKTTDNVSFEAATNLRTSLLEIGRKSGADVVMRQRGSALNSKFASDMTDGLKTAYPEWDPLRSLYAKGAEAKGLPKVKAARSALIKGGPTAFREAVRKEAAQTVPAGADAQALKNLRTIDDALTRARERGDKWGDRIYQFFEFSTAATLAYTHGPGAAASSLAVSELLPGLVVWASHNPTMTKLLQQGLTTKDTKVAMTLIGRVTEAYLTAQDQADQQAKADAVGQ